MLDWLVIGAGPQGMHLAQLLLNCAGARPSQLCVVDANPQPLAVWQRQTKATGMRYLRSPVAHHLGSDTRSLLEFAHQQGDLQQLRGRYRRPPLAMFNAHSQRIIQRASLPGRICQDNITGIRSVQGGYHLAGEKQTYKSRRVVLALGQPRPHWPEWAQGHTRIKHILEADAVGLPVVGDAHIVGGGLSAWQRALTHAAAGHKATIITRHGPRLAAFDADPCFLGPKCLRGFHAESDPARRADIIRQARQPGSVPPYLLAQIKQAQSQGKLDLIIDQTLDYRNDILRLRSGERLAAPTVILATGFGESPPGVELVRALDVPADTRGFALLNEHLEWRPGLFATGRLAELSLGPAAGNIAGARMAGKRLLAYCRVQ